MWVGSNSAIIPDNIIIMCAKVGNKMCLYKKKIKSNNGDLKSESL